MYIRTFDYMPEEAVSIRTEVFINEQHFKNEFDDNDKIATHLVVYENEEAIATCRYFAKDSSTYLVGRIAVKSSYRGKGIGRLMLEEAEKQIYQKGGIIMEVSAQVRVQPFYEKLGLQAEDSPYPDEGCPHILMRKTVGYKI